MKAFHRRLAVAVLAAPLAALPLVAAAQTAPAQQARPTGDGTISGKVAEVFGTKFVLETASGRTLVETGPAHRSAVDVQPGQELTVTGMLKPDNTFDAFLIRMADGREVVVRDPARGGPDRAPSADRGLGPRGETPPPPRHDRDPRRRDFAAGLDRAAIERIVAAEGYDRIDEIERKPRHYEVEAEDRNSEDVEIHIDLDGRITRIELDEPRYDVSGLRDVVERAGYRWRGDVERKGKHYEVDAVNPYGEEVELHVDFSGAIYKEKRDFD